MGPTINSPCTVDLPIITRMCCRILNFMFKHSVPGTAVPSQVAEQLPLHKSGSHSRPAARHGHILLRHCPLHAQPRNLLAMRHKSRIISHMDNATTFTCSSTLKHSRNTSHKSSPPYT